MPPKMGDNRLAAPCAMSSRLGSCRSPLKLSATTADNKASTPIRTAIVKAGRMSSSTRAMLIWGKLGAGRLDGTAPNKLEMVSTGNEKVIAMVVPTIKPIKAPGMRLSSGNFGPKTMATNVMQASSTDHALM